MSVVSSKMNLSGFDSTMKKLRGKYVTRIGILGDSDARPDGESNATIGLIQEFGSISGNIPPRSFLRMPIMNNKGKIFAMLTQATSKSLIEQGKIEEIYKRIGAIAQGIVIKAFGTRGYGKWAPNAPFTIAKKGSSAPLIDTAELSKSITYEVVKRKK